MNRFYRKCRDFESERGINPFYIVFGTVKYYDEKYEGYRSAPLLLMRLRLERERTNDGLKFTVTSDGELIKNRALFKKFEIDHGIDSSVEIEESGENEDDESDTSKAVGNFIKKINETHSRIFEKKKIQVENRMVLGVMPVGRFEMYEDINPDEFAEDALIQKLFNGDAEKSQVSGEEQDIENQQEREYINKRSQYLQQLDPSQRKVANLVLEGEDVVVQGPPGTGKSQVIIEMIIQSIAQGKKVLFMAQKQAALNVIQSRMEKLGFGDFILMLLPEKSGRKDVVESIRKSKDARLEHVSNTSLEQELKKAYERERKIREYQLILEKEVLSFGNTIKDVLYENTKGRSFKYDDGYFQDQVVIGDVYRSQDDVYRSHGNNDERSKEWVMVGSIHKSPGHDDGHPEDQVAVGDIYKSPGYDDGHLGKWVDKLMREITKERLEKAVENFVLYFNLSKEMESNPTEWNIININQHDDNIVNEYMSVAKNLADSTSSFSGYEKFKEDCDIKENEMKHLDKRFKELYNQMDEGRMDDQLIRRIIEFPTFLSEVENLKEEQNNVKEEIDACNKARNKIIRIKDLVEQFLKKFPSLREQSLEKIDRVSQRLSKVPTDVYNLKYVIKDREAEREYEEFKRNYQEYRRKKKELEKTFSMRYLSDKSSDIESIISFLNSVRISDLIFDKKADGWNDIDEILKIRRKYFKRLFLFLFKGKMIKRLQDAQEFSKLEIEIENNVYFDIEDDEDEVIKLYDSQVKFRRDIERDNSMTGINVEHLIENLVENGENFSFHPLNIDKGVLRVIGKMNIKGLEDHIKSKEKEIEQIKKKIKLSKESFKKVLGKYHRGIETSFEEIEKEIEFTKELLRDGNSARVELFNKILKSDIDKGKCSEFVESALEEEKKYKDNLKEFRQKTGIKSIESYFGNSLDSQSEKLNNLIKDIDGLQRKVRLEKFNRMIENDGMRKIFTVVQLIYEKNVPNEEFDSDMIFSILRDVIIKYNLGDFLSDGTIFDLDEELKKNEAEIHRLSEKQIKFNILEHPNNNKFPHGSGGKVRDKTEGRLINHEMSKQQSYIPVRDLLKRAPENIKSYKPCLAMPPESVPRYLSSISNFDLLIIDEASQMQPENALSAIRRSKQIVVIGDNKQLPPTNFFRSMFVEDEEDKEEQEKSLLEVAGGVCRDEKLKWHYRSKYPELIAFCNKHIYNDSLMLFPSHESNPSSIEYVQVNAKPEEIFYKSGVNIPEAKEIERWLLKFVEEEKNHDKSLAIVVMNKKQEEQVREIIDAISSLADGEMLEKYRKKHEEGEPFIIKNLENMQGDERDIVLIGLVYGPEKMGEKVRQSFGPINGSAGKRRLNVLFSRARERIVTFSSMKVGDVELKYGQDGRFLLKEWIRYSQTGQLDTGEETGREPDSEFEKMVAKEIEKTGYEVEPQVGVTNYFIDIGVRSKKNEKKFCLGVECDGSQYHSTQQQIRYDKYRQGVLEDKGWEIHRIWSIDWFNNKEEEIKKLQDKLREVDRIGR